MFIQGVGANYWKGSTVVTALKLTTETTVQQQIVNPCQDFEILQQRFENPRQKERNSINCHKTF